jgi:sugar-specific transcriptional regulator TrmB
MRMTQPPEPSGRELNCNPILDNTFLSANFRRMFFEHRLKLEQLGLSPAEAQIYLAVLRHGSLAAPAIAAQTGIARTSVYPTLCSLAEKGLIEGGLGHGSKFTAVAPEEALPALVVREEHTLAERQQIAKELAETLAPLAVDADSTFEDSVQLIRTPHLMGERAQRLMLEATRLVEIVVKAPIFNIRPWNPAQRKAMQRGVHIKALYEGAVLEDPNIAGVLHGFIEAGEEARIYDGELPYKLAVFDQGTVLLTLPKRNGQPTAAAAMLIRNAPFARSMSIVFDFFWNQANAVPTAAPAKNAAKLRDRKQNARLAAAIAPKAQSQAVRRNTHLEGHAPKESRKKSP